MRLRCFLLVVVFIIAACCCSLADADGIIMVKNLATDSNRVVTNDGNVKRRYLKGSKTTAEDEERGFLGITNLKTLLEKVPYLDKLKSLVRKNPELGKAKVVAVKGPTEYSKRQAALAIVKGQLKPMAIIAALALAGGYIAYLVKG